MKLFNYLIFVLGIQLLGGGLVQADGEKNVLYQVSTVDALVGGVMDGEVDFKTLKEKGDFGIGTFNALDGEMLALDGEFYQVKSDGTVSIATADMKTPFSSIIFFEAGKKTQMEDAFLYSELAQKLDPLLGTKNFIYAVRIDGVFDYIKTRSVPRQKKPYPPLTEVVKTQPTFEFRNVRGTLVGFRFPEYMSGLNVRGYHFHFITEDRKGGGHVLDWKVGNVEVKIAEISDFQMALPHNEEFYQIDLSQDKKADLAKVEQASH